MFFLCLQQLTCSSSRFRQTQCKPMSCAGLFIPGALKHLFVGLLVSRLVGRSDIISSKAAFRIHLILTWIRIRILGSTLGKSGSGSSDPPFSNSGSGSSDPHLEKVDPDPVPKWIQTNAFLSGSGSELYSNILR